MERDNIDDDNAHIAVPDKFNVFISSDATKISLREEQPLRLSSMRDFEWKWSFSITLHWLESKYVSLWRDEQTLIWSSLRGFEWTLIKAFNFSTFKQVQFFHYLLCHCDLLER